MATFTNTITSVGNLYQAENMTFGGPVGSTADLQRQVADLQTLLARLPDVPEETRAEAARSLAEASATPAAGPEGANKIVAKLEGTRSLLQAATGAARQVAPLIGAIGAVIGAASGLIA